MTEKTQVPRVGGEPRRSGPSDALMERLMRVRSQSSKLSQPLSDADATVQSMPDASPMKWHLAHTSWFFEEFVLVPHVEGYTRFDDRFPYLFNSYYEAMGKRHARPKRGMLTRPTLEDVRAYRAHVDTALRALDEGQVSQVSALLELGLNHEEQHQELMLSDILHLFAENPLKPGYTTLRYPIEEVTGILPLAWHPYSVDAAQIGAPETGFAFDCERPRHARLVPAFEIANRPVTNGEWMEFITDGGYSTAQLWLSDGWAAVNEQGWHAPLYWEERDGLWWRMTLGGMVPVDSKAPVSHISYFEADAYASWAGARLPREEEWEVMASGEDPADGHFADSDYYRPRALSADPGLQAVFGSVWEWTQSAYQAYPGFRSLEGAPGEYNGKFMCGQFVLRGGSCITPAGHIRPSYRNFFYPHQRWQFSGLRLARDV